MCKKKKKKNVGVDVAVAFDMLFIYAGIGMRSDATDFPLLNILRYKYQTP